MAAAPKDRVAARTGARALTVKIRHRFRQPSGVLAQLLDRDDVIDERKFVEDDHDDQELLRAAVALAATNDNNDMIRLLFPDHHR